MITAPDVLSDHRVTDADDYEWQPEDRYAVEHVLNHPNQAPPFSQSATNVPNHPASVALWLTPERADAHLEDKQLRTAAHEAVDPDEDGQVTSSTTQIRFGTERSDDHEETVEGDASDANGHRLEGELVAEFHQLAHDIASVPIEGDVPEDFADRVDEQHQQVTDDQLKLEVIGGGEH